MQKKHSRRFFLKLLNSFFLFLALPSCQKQQALSKELPYHHLPNGSFRNLQGAPVRDPKEAKGKTNPFGFTRLVQKIFSKSEEVVVPAKYTIPESTAIKNFYDNTYNIKITWLGHAAFLIKLGDNTILTDPFLTDRAGIGFFGPKRFAGPAISIEKLPPIDIILISHSHYDHLDSSTLKKIKNKAKIQVITPLKLANTIKKEGYSKVTEMDWYQQKTINNFRITCLPSAHWSRRLGQAKNTTLWAGYLLEYNGKKIYFAGDTAYSKTIFKHLATIVESPDLALVPIGAYKPRWFMRSSHTTPEEAVQICSDLKCKNIIGMHWGSIRLSTEDLWEPPKKFEVAALKMGYSKKQVWIMAMGETKSLI